jgi:hypothetical protein
MGQLKTPLSCSLYGARCGCPACSKGLKFVGLQPGWTVLRPLEWITAEMSINGHHQQPRRGRPYATSADITMRRRNDAQSAAHPASAGGGPALAHWLEQLRQSRGLSFRKMASASARIHNSTAEPCSHASFARVVSGRPVRRPLVKAFTIVCRGDLATARRLRRKAAGTPAAPAGGRHEAGVHHHPRPTAQRYEEDPHRLRGTDPAGAASASGEGCSW